MKHRSVRVALAVAFLATLAIVGYRVASTETLLTAERAAGRAFDERTGSLEVALTALGAAQQAYVADGQDEAYWFAQVTDSLTEARTTLTELQALASAPGSRDALMAAGSILTELGEMDERARDYASSDQRLMASDLIFTDGLELQARAAEELARARALEHAAREAALGLRRQSQAILLAVAGGIGIVSVLLLLASGSAAPRTAPVQSAAIKRPVTAPDVARAGTGAEAPSDGSAPAAPSGARTGAPAAQSTRPADLDGVARLCIDLSRASRGDELPGLLARAAGLIEARGIILWLADESRSALRPAMAHGYPTRLIARMGSIAQDDESATATAYRDATLLTVNGTDDRPGAIVAPLLSSTGCLGVMAAEVRSGAESSSAVRALTSIVSAQLATLVAHPRTDAGMRDRMATRDAERDPTAAPAADDLPEAQSGSA